MTEETVAANPLPDLPPGYRARPATRDDAPALVDLLSACDVDVTGTSDMTLNDFLGDWEEVDPGTETLLVEDETGRAAAYADLSIRGHVVTTIYGYVHPEQRGRGLGAYLNRWGERRALEEAEHAPQGARIAARAFVNERSLHGTRLMEELGYTPVRTTYTMAIDLTGPPPAPAWPEGVSVRTYVPGQDEQATHQALEAAFADLWSRPPGTLDDFLAKTRRPYFDPSLWFLAGDGRQIVGTNLASNVDGQGWIEGVGVRRAWRGRGLALAMLLHAFGELYARGVTHIGLSVDAQSPTGALRLYERAGMRLNQSFRLYERELRPGFEVTSELETQ